MTKCMPEPVIKYVDFQTATQHMLNGGRAKFIDVNDDKIGKNIYTFNSEVFIFRDESDKTVEYWLPATFKRKYITDNGWILL